MPLIPAERSVMAAAEAVRLPNIGIHTADPGLTGANEHPATNGYARKAAGWGAAVDGTATTASTVTSAELTFDVGPGTYTHYSYQSALTGGVYRGSGTLAQPRTIDAPGGQLKVTVSLPVLPVLPA